MQARTALSGIGATLLGAALATASQSAFALSDGYAFNRLTTVEVSDPTIGNPGSEVAEIVAASRNGRTLVYTDSEAEGIGFFDITDPTNPTGDGFIPLDGEPTSVAVHRRWALVAVNTSEDFVNTSGQLVVVRMNPPRVIVRKIEIDGQPDSIAVSPDGRHAAIAIENERNEDLCVGGTHDGQEVDEDDCAAGGGTLGGLPQFPAGYLEVVDLKGHPWMWKTERLELTGLNVRFNKDPEPEFVDIDERNYAVVSLQENNGFAIVDLENKAVVNSFKARKAKVKQVDTVENDIIEPTDIIKERREPDAVKWLDNGVFASADEGDLDGGSRTFTLFQDSGEVVYNPKNQVEHIAIHVGHYPEDRSENKGVEPEGLEVASMGQDKLLFAGLERANLIEVWKVPPFGNPEFMQALPTGIGPEGILAIPKRRLLIVANEVTEGGFKSSLGIYRLEKADPIYPTIHSVLRETGEPLPWGALSALAADRDDPDILYTVHDSYYTRSRIYTLDVSSVPALITHELELTKDGSPVDYDLEGLTQRACGGFWAVSEGSNDNGEDTTPNLLLQIDPDGNIAAEVPLPPKTNTKQRRFGLEGVAVRGECDDKERVYVAFQREWDYDRGASSVGPYGGDTQPTSDCLMDGDCVARIGRYNVQNGKWKFVNYPLDAPTSPEGGWVGLSEIVHLGDRKFAVIERDNQAGAGATIKQVCTFSIGGGLKFRSDKKGKTPDFDTIADKQCMDVLPDLQAPGGQVLDKLEGLAVTVDGRVFAVTDNDGVEEAPGETQLLLLGHVTELP